MGVPWESKMSKYHFLTIFFLTAAILLSPGADVQAQSSTPSVSVTGNPSAKTQSNKNSKTEPSRPAKRPQHVVSEQRVEHLLGFVEQHHAASLPLLKVLKEKRAKKFARVMVHLDREVAGLDRLKDRSQRAYSNALKQWVNRSQIKLLIAKLKTETAKKESTKARRDDLTKQIRKLLNENVDIRVQQLSFEIKIILKIKFDVIIIFNI